ncbi:MAG: hypothetical protein JWO37_509 [Acidimicrobiales bacterium]|nr:hypothetical protein [Acidimicrobiales bacterium]
MSHPIDIDRVDAVLLSDGWHFVFPQTFDLGVYSFIHPAGGKHAVLFDGGTGFGFSEKDTAGEIRRLSGPVASILAVRYTRESDDD